MVFYCHHALASFPDLRPASRRLPYCKQQEAGRRPGNEACATLLSSGIAIKTFGTALQTSPCNHA